MHRATTAVRTGLAVPALILVAATMAACGPDPAIGRDAGSAVVAGQGAATAATDAAGAVAAGSAPAVAPVGSATAVLPAIEVIDLASGRPVSLASLVAPDKPTLFWAWAPY